MPNGSHKRGAEVNESRVTLAEPDLYFAMLERSALHHWWSVGVERIERRWVQNEFKSGVRGTVATRKWLDVGCGTGRRLAQWSQWGFWEMQVGIDPSPISMNHEMGSIARLQGKLPGLPLMEPCFDLVTAFDVIQHVSKPIREQALSEISRVVKPGGILLIRTNSGGFWGKPQGDDSIAERNWLDQALNEFHFRIVRSSHFNMTGGFIEDFMKRYCKWQSWNCEASTTFKTGLPQQWQARPDGHWLGRWFGSIESRIAGTGLVKIPFGHSYLVMARKEVDHD